MTQRMPSRGVSRRLHRPRTVVRDVRRAGWRRLAPQVSQIGDTLIELLIATVIIALASVALVGGLAAAAGSSGQHRSLATLDTLLKSFAETAKVQLEGPGGLFNCSALPNPSYASPDPGYLLLSPPNPPSGPAGTAVTIFATGMTPDLTPSMNAFTVGFDDGTEATNVIGSSDQYGNAEVTFTIPANITPGARQITVTSNGSGADSVVNEGTTTFLATATGSAVSPSPLAGYTMGITKVQNWDGSVTPPTFDSTSTDCQQIGLQMVTFSATAPDGANDTLSIIVNNTNTPLPAAPIITGADCATFQVGLSGQQNPPAGAPNPCTPPSNQVGQPFQFTATGYPPSVFSENITSCPPQQGGGACPTLSDIGLDMTSRLLGGTPDVGSGGVYVLSITATNGINPPGTESFDLYVDEAPSITSASTTGFDTTTPNSSFAFAATGYPDPAFTEAGSLPSGVTFNAASGVLTGTSGAAAGSYPLTITASNGIDPTPTAAETAADTQDCPEPNQATNSEPEQPDGGNCVQAFTLIVGTAPTISPSSASATFIVGESGTYKPTATETPTNAPITWTASVTSCPQDIGTCSLPAGVSLDSSTGVLSGTPASTTNGGLTGGVYVITITATNAVGSGNQTLTLTVDQAPTFITSNGSPIPFSVTTPPTPNSVVVEVGGYPPPVTTTESSCSLYSPGFFGGLFPESCPNGLITWTQSTDTLSGTPSSTYLGDSEQITLKASDSFKDPPTSQTATTHNTSETFTVDFDQGPAITSASSTTFVVGQNGTFTVTASGTPTPTISETGSLPDNVTFGQNGGFFGGGSYQLTGTPQTGTGGVYTGIQFTATNEAGSASQDFTLTIDESPSFTSASTMGVTEGSSFSLPIRTDGWPSPTVTESGTPLPSWVTFTPSSSGGTLSGTAPGSTGSYTTTFTATNTYGGNTHTATQAFTLVVGTAPEITSTVDCATFVVGLSGQQDPPGGQPDTCPPASNQVGSGVQFSASGYPAPTFSETVISCPTPSSGYCSLPGGLTLSNGGLLSGTPASGSAGTYDIQISASNVVGSATQDFVLYIYETPTSFSITANSNSSSLTVTYGTTVTLAESGLPSNATGTVTFSYTVGSGTTTLCSVTLPNHTSCQITPSAGSYAISASYGGNGTYYPSTSNTVTVTVSQATPTFTITADGSSTSDQIDVGSQATLAESGLPSDATGMVTFTSGGTTLCSFSLSNGHYGNNNSCNTSSSLAVGAYTISATFTDTDGNYTGASSQNSVTLYVTTPTSFTITANGSTGTVPALSGSTITLAETGLPSGAAGTVTFYYTTGYRGTTTNICTATQPTTSCSTSTLAVGSYSVSASYSGSTTSLDSPSTSSNTITLDVQMATSFTITISAGTPSCSSPSSSLTVAYGTTVHLAECGLPSGATGTVTFGEGSWTGPCQINLSQSTSCSFTTPAVATYSGILATYTGDTTHQGSNSSNTVTLTVSKASTSFSITVGGSSTSATITQGSRATLAESGLPSGATGAVTFTSGATQLCSFNLSATTTSCNTSTSLAAGTYSGISAAFTDTDGNYQGSPSSNTVKLTVLVPTSFSITVGGSSTSATITKGNQATLAESGLPSGATGTVTFTSSGGTQLCSFNLSATTTSCNTSTSLAAGTYSGISAAFTDTDGTYSGSTSSNTVKLTVLVPTSFSITVGGSSTSATITKGNQATLAESGLPSGATGTVTFTSSGGTQLCSFTLSFFTTSCRTSTSLAAGTYSGIQGTFTDTDGIYSNSTSSNTVTLTVDQ